MPDDASRLIPDPGFPDDDGSADPELTEVLDRFRAGSAAHAQVLAALAPGRLLVPVVAVLGEVEVDAAGLAHDKTSDMAAVLVRGADGRRGLLAFSGTDALHAWDPQARPVPVPAATAATAALQEGAAALLVDLAGPVPFVVTGDDLARLAAGWRVVAVGDAYGWIGPAHD